MEQQLRIVAPGKVQVGIHFFTAQNKSAIEIHRELCSSHHRISWIDIKLLYAELTFLLNFNSWFVLDGRKMNNCAHLARCNYTQQKLHFQSCVLHIFVKWSPYNFYSFWKNSTITCPCNLTLMGSQNAEKKNRVTYFWDNARTSLIYHLIMRFLKKYIRIKIKSIILLS